MLSEKELLSLVELLAHKLKNPSHTMGLNLEVLQSKIEKSGQVSKTELLKLVQIISRELQRQNQIIQKHVQFMAPAGNSPKKLKLKSLIALVRAEVMPLAQEKQVTLNFEAINSSLAIKANQAEMVAALRELLFNAIEASAANESVLIRVLEQKGEVVIEIEDHGDGINKKEAGKILELYYSGKSGHIGMGLPLAKKYIEDNGGKLRMRTAVKKGTTILISFAQ